MPLWQRGASAAVGLATHAIVVVRGVSKIFSCHSTSARRERASRQGPPVVVGLSAHRHHYPARPCLAPISGCQGRSRQRTRAAARARPIAPHGGTRDETGHACRAARPTRVRTLPRKVAVRARSRPWTGDCGVPYAALRCIHIDHEISIVRAPTAAICGRLASRVSTRKQRPTRNRVPRGCKPPVATTIARDHGPICAQIHTRRDRRGRRDVRSGHDSPRAITCICSLVEATEH